MRYYVSCVANLDPDSDLYVNWFVSGPFQAYIPSTEAREWRRLKDDASARPVSGCIQYGNLGDVTPADFWGTADDEAEVSNSGKCAQSGGGAQANQSGPLPEGGLQEAVKLFVPSDVENPHDTMLQIDGQVGIEPAENGGYKSYFYYAADKYKNRPLGDPNQIKVVPVFPIQSENFLAAFLKDNNGTTALSLKGQLNFYVPAAKNAQWSTIPAYYEFLDKNDRPVGAIPMPLFGIGGDK